MQRTYAEAIRLLRSRTRLAKATRADEPRLNVPNNYSMVEWLSQLGHTNLSALNVIHITGTKGKGSTAAFTASILHQHFSRLKQPVRIGLYTSPHVITERDRIRINHVPVSEAVFASAFFEVWDALRCGEPGYRPGYLQLLALISVHIFKKAQVDVAIYEVHAGGRKDATNIFERPVVCGFSRIGLDHAELLGPTVESIAWHKSGIMKRGRPAYSVRQDDVPDGVLKAQAEEIGADLRSVEVWTGLPSHPNVSQQAQRENASLAIALAKTTLEERGHALLEEDIEMGVAKCAWPGRFQHLHKDGVDWCLDSAHNELSIPVAISWFASQSKMLQKQTAAGICRRILIFGHSSDRSTERLVDVLLQSCAKDGLQFDQVILSSYDRYDVPIPESVAKEQLGFWSTKNLNAPIQHAINADAAINMVKNLQYSFPDVHFQVLVTGSAHLVGQSLRALGGEDLVMSAA